MKIKPDELMGASKNYFPAAILAFWLRLRQISQKVLNVASGYACGLFSHLPYLAQKSKISRRKVVFRGALIRPKPKSLDLIDALLAGYIKKASDKNEIDRTKFAEGMTKD